MNFMIILSESLSGHNLYFLIQKKSFLLATKLLKCITIQVFTGYNPAGGTGTQI